MQSPMTSMQWETLRVLPPREDHPHKIAMAAPSMGILTHTACRAHPTEEDAVEVVVIVAGAAGRTVVEASMPMAWQAVAGRIRPSARKRRPRGRGGYGPPPRGAYGPGGMRGGRGPPPNVTAMCPQRSTTNVNPLPTSTRSMGSLTPQRPLRTVAMETSTRLTITTFPVPSPRPLCRAGNPWSPCRRDGRNWP